MFKCFVPVWKCIFISSWIDSFKALLPSEWSKQNTFILSFYQEKKNSSSIAQLKHFFLFFFFSASLATVANNFIICIALIAVIKQTQQMLTLHKASSQPHGRLSLYFFFIRERDWNGFVLDWNCQRYFIFFFLIQTVTLSFYSKNNFTQSLASRFRDITTAWTWYSLKEIRFQISCSCVTPKLQPLMLLLE